MYQTHAAVSAGPQLHATVSGCLDIVHVKHKSPTTATGCQSFLRASSMSSSTFRQSLLLSSAPFNATLPARHIQCMSYMFSVHPYVIMRWRGAAVSTAGCSASAADDGARPQSTSVVGLKGSCCGPPGCQKSWELEQQSWRAALCWLMLLMKAPVAVQGGYNDHLLCHHLVCFCAAVEVQRLHIGCL